MSHPANDNPEPCNPSHRRLLIALACVALAAPACDGETGIIIEVSKGDGFDQAPDSLRFLVGVEAEGLDLGATVTCGAADTTLARFVRAPESPDDIADVSGRDLHANPYRLLLKPDAELSVDRHVLVAVGAFANGQLIGVGALEAPVEFIPGKVLRWPITLVPRTATVPAGINERCLCASEYLGYDAVITPPDDMDCDGDLAPLDCNDNDSSVGPSRPELCGNLVDDNCDNTIDERIEEVCDGVDNNCDGRCDEGFDVDGDKYTTCGSIADKCDGIVSQELVDCDPANPNVYPGAPELCDGLDNNCIPDDARFPETTYCYDLVNADGVCHLGQRQCRDDTVGWVSECQAPGDDAYIATPELCESFAACPESPDQFECANDIFNDMNCELYIIADQPGSERMCPGAAQTLYNPGVPNMIGCTFTLLGNGLEAPFNAFLFGANTQTSGPVIQDCHVSLNIESLRGPAQDDQLLVWYSLLGEPATHVRANIVVKFVNTELECPVPSLVCDATTPNPAP